MKIKKFSEWLKDGAFNIVTNYGTYSVVDVYKNPIYVWQTFVDLKDAKLKKTELNAMDYETIYSTDFLTKI